MNLSDFYPSYFYYFLGSSHGAKILVTPKQNCISTTNGEFVVIVMVQHSSPY